MRSTAPMRRVFDQVRMVSKWNTTVLLRGETGRPTDISVDLIWSTSGIPYQYRWTTRYEIACTVSGTVTVDGRVHPVQTAPGQRDHSWGVRDWWGMDWVWSALHLDDGTHLHAVEVRIPDAPRVGTGYTQFRDEPLVELEQVTAREMFAANSLPVSAALAVEPGGVVANCEVLAHAPVRLAADDGRISEFPRAWVAVTMADGRTGTGWMEWNRNLG